LQHSSHSLQPVYAADAVLPGRDKPSN